MARTRNQEELKVLNEECVDLPNCPVCGYITDLEEIVVNRTKEAGGGRWTSYILRCLNSIDPDRLRQLQQPGVPLCTFAVPMTFHPPKG